jgi:dienelactone hydrolase
MHVKKGKAMDKSDHCLCRLLSLRTAFAFVLTIVAGLSSAADVERRAVNIWSDGTRMSGDLWLPADFGDGVDQPAILLTHGWGGVRSHLNQSYAPKFARAGFVVLTFDYRGWEDSDSRLVIDGEQPQPDGDGLVTVKARAIREVVDPFDQVRDITSALDFLVGEPGVDVKRIGIWGTSYSGGHVIYVGAYDPRVSAIVSQVGYQGIGWSAERLRFAQKRATDKARGVIDPIPQGIDVSPNLRGTPDLGKMVGYRPIEAADKVRAPTLVIDVKEEELFDRMKNGKAVYEIIKKNTIATYATYPGRHYGIYSRHYLAASTLALNWFRTHLMQ